MGAACVSVLLFYRYTHPLCYNHAHSKPGTSLCTAGVSSDCLGYYLLVLQQDQAELGPTLCRVQTSCVCSHHLMLYTQSISRGERRGWNCATASSSQGHAPGEQWSWRKSSGWGLANSFAPTSFLEYSQIFTGRSLYRWALDQIYYNYVTKKYYSVIVPCP